MAKTAIAEDTALIYGLIDPSTDQIRYVGKTIRGAVPRVRHHINRAKNNPTANNVSVWIASLTVRGLAPEIVVLETVRHCDWHDAEKFWISYWKSIGANLTNMTIGGGATEGHCHSIRTKTRLSEIATVQFASASAREKAKEYGRLPWQNADYRQKMQATKTDLTAAQRQVRAESRRKLWAENQDYRDKVIAAQKLVDRTAVAKAFWDRPEYRKRQAAARAKRKARGWNVPVLPEPVSEIEA